MLRFLEAHNGLSAILVDRSNYDGIWVSSLTHSASKGLPDNELVDIRERAKFLHEIRALSKKPILVDIDSGGKPEHLENYIKCLAPFAWGVVMEDKKGSKQNSLLEENSQELEDVDTVCQKIKIIKDTSRDLKLFARIESLIAKKSVYDALIRAEAYLKAGADGIVIHSKQKVECSEVMEFARKFRFQFGGGGWLVAIPTTYKLPEEHPFDIIIDANHLLRASLKGMKDFLDGNANLASVKDIFDLVGK